MYKTPINDAGSILYLILSMKYNLKGYGFASSIIQIRYRRNRRFRKKIPFLPKTFMGHKVEYIKQVK